MMTESLVSSCRSSKSISTSKYKLDLAWLLIAFDNGCDELTAADACHNCLSIKVFGESLA